MSTCRIDGVALPQPAYIPDPFDAAMAAEAKAHRLAASATMDAILDDIRCGGRRTAGVAVKQRAKNFRRRPEMINLLPGLDAFSTPEQIIAAASMRIDQERERRWIGMGGETVVTNCRGAILYARWLRRVYRAAAQSVTRAA